MELMREIVNKIKEIPEDQLDNSINFMIKMNKINNIDEQMKFRDSILGMYYSE